LFVEAVEVELEEEGGGFVLLFLYLALVFVEVSSSSGGPRRGQISSASKRESSRVRLGAWSFREPERGPLPLPFALLLLGMREGGRGEFGPIGRCSRLLR
jgi:hypothetical protein